MDRIDAMIAQGRIDNRRGAELEARVEAELFMGGSTVANSVTVADVHLVDDEAVLRADTDLVEFFAAYQ